jgi:hypothetical protein
MKVILILLRHSASLVEALRYKRRGSSPDEVDIFDLPNPSSRTIALG